MRLDLYLAEKNLTDSRTRAKNLIVMGNVTVNGKTVEKVSFDVSEGDDVRIVKNYDVSLGGIKLREALRVFQPDITNKKCLDIGASNGGFCEVLLEKGALKVIALDVGECALPMNMQKDERIFIMDKTNARTLLPTQLPFIPDFITVDVSFISLTQVLPVVYSCLLPAGKAICLIKPQFECGKNALSKKGVVLREKDAIKAIDNIKKFSEAIGFKIEGVCQAPHPFENKNQEYFIFLSKNIA